jgi:hypothetical protein
MAASMQPTAQPKMRFPEGFSDTMATRKPAPRTIANVMKNDVADTLVVPGNVVRPNDKKMSDGGRGRAVLGMGVWKSSEM